MALISIIQDFHPQADTRLLARAAELTPALRHAVREPVGAFRLRDRYSREREELEPSPSLQAFPKLRLGKGDNLCLDFGEHLVGRLALELDGAGSHPDAPVLLKLKFAEIPEELSEDSQTYDGWLSRSWIQEETIHIDQLPARLSLPRRYAFRYVKFTVLDTSPKYKLVVRRVECVTESSADWRGVAPLACGDPLLDRIHAVSLRTLADCMQLEFEDGPKRDRRLWLGDLRLTALSNAVSFRNFDLVKRCLYLFAGSRFPDGRVSACVFTHPAVEADDTYLLDYALLYAAALEEYLVETGDGEALDDLYDVAMAQVEYGLDQHQGNGLLTPQAVKDCFIDWCDELDKTACATAVLIYALEYGERLALRKNDGTRAKELRRDRDALRHAAAECFWSETERCFVSNGQISAATQIWITLAEVGSMDQRRRAMERALALTDGPRIGTPYLHHYYVMALLQAGLRTAAEQHLKDYWGGMLTAGADTFWECWDGAHPELSPYGGLLVNSYCHAWSCTPAWIIQRCLLPHGNL